MWTWNLNRASPIIFHIPSLTKVGNFCNGGSLGCYVFSVFWFSLSVIAVSLPEKRELFYYKIGTCIILKNLNGDASQLPQTTF